MTTSRHDTFSELNGSNTSDIHPTNDTLHTNKASNDGVKLSICIPTFNRHKIIGRTLHSILSQIGPYKDLVEIIVSDNHSDVPVGDIVKSLSEQFDVPVRYVYQPENIDSEPNFQYLINNSIGEYIHLVGDDDLLAPFFYATFMPYIKQGGYSLMVCDSLDADADMKTLTHDGRTEFREMLMIRSFEEHVTHCMAKGGLTTNCIFSRETWNAGEGRDYSPYFRYLTFARELFGALRLNQPCVYSGFPLVIQRGGRQHHFINEYFDSVVLGRLNLFRDLDKAGVPGLYKRVINHYFSSFPYPPEFAEMGANRTHYLQTYTQYLRHFTGDKAIWLNFWLKTPFYKFMIRHQTSVNKWGSRLLHLRSLILRK